MSKILRIGSSDYRVKVRDGGTITLDVGLDPDLNLRGTVRITGNLDVIGKTTTVESSNTTIQDNIIILNRGETGAGVTLNNAGIEIDRGTLDAAQFVWDEPTNKFIIRTTDGTVSTLSGITVGNISTDPTTDLNFDMQNGSGLLRIANSSGYSALISAALAVNDNDVIPNARFILDYVSAGLVITGQADVDRIYKGHGLNPTVVDTEVLATTNSIEFFIGGTSPITNQRAIITNNGLSVDNVNVRNNVITSHPFGGSGVVDLVLSSDSNYVEVNSVLTLSDRSSFESAASGKTKLFSRSTLSSLNQTPGRTGIFFSNAISTDELVSKSRALLFSILF